MLRKPRFRIQMKRPSTIQETPTSLLHQNHSTLRMRKRSTINFSIFYKYIMDKTVRAGLVERNLLSIDIQMASAYKCLHELDTKDADLLSEKLLLKDGEPRITQLEKLLCPGVLGLVDVVHDIPSDQWPSDHLAIMGVFHNKKNAKEQFAD